MVRGDLFAGDKHLLLLFDRFRFFQEAVNILLLGLDRRMNGVMAQVQEERALLAGLDQADCFVGDAVGEIFALRALLQRMNAVGAEIALVRMAQEQPPMFFSKPKCSG